MSMFFNRREVKRARKNYGCAFCGKLHPAGEMAFIVADADKKKGG